MRPAVVVSKTNPASVTIRDSIFEVEVLEEKGGGVWSGPDFDLVEYEGSIVEIVPSYPASYYIFASTHRSESGKDCLTVHTPGNWGEAALGGKPFALNISLPFCIKAAAQEMKRLSASRLGWEVYVEVDHHGPSLDVPVMFAEIGSTDSAWKNKEAGRIVAGAILAAIRNKCRWAVYVGFGGSHYAPKFAPKIIDGEIAIGHIISGYALESFGIDEQRVRQAIEKNLPAAEGALIDWKGMGSAARKKLIEMLEKVGVKWERC
ncbi:MAG: hypothetical protein N3G80_03845 [Candidatus Micrarchaeota archaeon]|nr:hypothetical protein [Candidatus Micrarchaeota archaeon]